MYELSEPDVMNTATLAMNVMQYSAVQTERCAWI